jgi:hypothetical protein
MRLKRRNPKPYKWSGRVVVNEPINHRRGEPALLTEELLREAIEATINSPNPRRCG